VLLPLLNQLQKKSKKTIPDMQRVSSQLTIILRVALPTTWLTLILSITILLGWTIRGKAGLMANPIIWISLLIILGTGFVFIKFLLWRLYRIDLDNHFLYISNYFKTYKYDLTDIESIRESKILPGRIFCIRLKSKGSFGKNIYFLAAQSLWKDYIDTHPEQMTPLLKKVN
jgi:hypothetical protein